nr:helix-turn-helix domain-containing protein [Mycobacterium xenopi]
MSLEEHKRRERAQAIGLFRYQLICPALDEGLSTKQRGKLVREIAGQTHADPFGNQVRISRETLDRWIRRYRAGGCEALVPPRGGWRPAPMRRCWSWRRRSSGKTRPARWRRWLGSCAPPPGGRPRNPRCCATSIGSI